MKNQFHSHLAPLSQREPLDSRQVPNSAGGYVYQVDNWRQIRRFLILGTTGGTFYIKERTLTRENVDAIKQCITEDGLRTVKEIVKVSNEGLAHSNDPALFALALVMTHGDVTAKREAANALSQVARIPTHLFHFATYIDSMRGWGRVVKDAVSGWYKNKPVGQLALHLMKYQSRDGWSNRDMLRLSHPKGEGDYQTLFSYAVGKNTELNLQDDYARGLFSGQLAAQLAAEQKDWNAVANAVRQFRLPRELIPTEALNAPEVWSALLDDMPLGALLRNLGNMQKHGVLDSRAVAKLTAPGAVEKARVHPLSVFTTMAGYSSGQSRSGGKWQPDRQIIAALEQTLNEAMRADAVQQLGKRVVVGVDISGSMDCPTTMTEHFTCKQLGGALACVLANSQGVEIMAYGTSMHQVPQQLLFSKSPFVWASAFAQINGGGTDCALPIQYAINRVREGAVPFDAIINITDNETWAGQRHAASVLSTLRALTQRDVKYINIQMATNSYVVADPKDRHVLEVVGFDVSALPAIKSFVRDEL